MAHLLSQSLPGSPLDPVPASPVVHAGHRRLMMNRFLVATVGWTFGFAVPGLVSIPQILEHGPMAGFGTFGPEDVVGPVVAFGILLTGVIALADGLVSQFDASEHVVGWAGYGRRRRLNQDMWDVVAPPGMAWTLLMPPLVGAVAGLTVTAVGSAMRGETWIAVGTGLVGAVAAVLTIPAGRRALAAVAVVRRTALTTRWVIANGRHSVARVESMTYTGAFVAGNSEFAVTLVSEHDGVRSTFDLRVLEHPVWAPVPGTEYDMWTMDDLPPDVANADRIVVERRYLGRDPVGDPTAYRHEGGEGTTWLAPKWVGKEADVVARTADDGARVQRKGTAIGRTILPGMLTTSILLVLAQIDPPPVAFIGLGVLLAFTTVHTALGWAFARRARWIVRSGVQSNALTPVGFLMLFTAVPMVMLNGPMLGETIDGAPVTTAHIVTWTTVGLFAIVFGFGVASRNDAPHLFNGELEASAEAIQQALTTHDPAAADRLEAETGVRIGVGMLL